MKAVVEPELERSIPACAGEPSSRYRHRVSNWVDPRVCGGAFLGRLWNSIHSGRSPRVRGSRGYDGDEKAWCRSIPACAGEPPRSSNPAVYPEVDPRVCGGAGEKMGITLVSEGRSPRVRGSHGVRGGRAEHDRSIPACAGEPRCNCATASGCRVDPRVCGGAPGKGGRYAVRLGRSPRVRGSRARTSAMDALVGSIPACAGEPWCPRRPCRTRQVDPRVCGGAGETVAV